jgi:hypothetical protein
MDVTYVLVEVRKSFRTKITLKRLVIIMTRYHIMRYDIVHDDAKMKDAEQN